MEYFTDTTKLSCYFVKFLCYIQRKDNNSAALNFRDRNGFLGREEDYKSQIAEDARRELEVNLWRRSWIGTGKINIRVKKAVGKSGNLISPIQQAKFNDKLDSAKASFVPHAEEVLYDLYKGNPSDERKIFTKVSETFGKKYDLLSYLYFIKDDSRFLPSRPTHFDNSFKLLGLDFKMSNRCSWENYTEFINIIKEIKRMMEKCLPLQGTLRLIDAHSFAWIIQENKFLCEDFTDIKDVVEEYTERIQEQMQKRIVVGKGGTHVATVPIYDRASEVTLFTKQRANGICQLCNQPAPFNDKKGNPYLESHHVIWLSEEGSDSTSNTVALCPNCHRKMHVLNDLKDVDTLLSIIKNY